MEKVFVLVWFPFMGTDGLIGAEDNPILLGIFTKETGPGSAEEARSNFRYPDSCVIREVPLDTLLRKE